MDQNTAFQPLLMEQAAAWGIRQFKENKVPFLASILFGLLAYAYAFTNKLVNHDEVGQLFGKGATVSSGRWGLGALDSIFPNYSMPWIYGILTIILIAIAICIIIRIFSIQNKLLQVLLAGSIMVFPSLIGLFGYMFTSTSYAVSFLLAVLAVWCLLRSSRLFILPALCCMVLSLSIYQSYLSIAVGLLVLVLIQRLLKGDNLASVFKNGIFYVSFLVLSLGIYYIATQVILRLVGSTFNSYANDALVLSIPSVINGVFLAYSNFIRFFSESLCGLIPTPFSRIVHIILITATAILLGIWAVNQKKNDVLRILFLLALIAVLPLAINCMYLITSAASIHTLVLYSFIAVYLLAVIVADELAPISVSAKTFENFRRIAINLVVLALVLLLVINTYIANEAYLCLHLRYENTYAFYTALIADIKMMPQFQPETKVAIIGHYGQPAFFYERFQQVYPISGIYGMLPDSHSNAEFMDYYIGMPLSFASAYEIAEIQASSEFAQMPLYPYYGSMQMLGDILVVKLS